jgi:hypothetical protein
MNNQETILEIRNQSEKILNRVENEKLQQDFRIGEIAISNEKILLHGKELEGRAKAKILSTLKVKKNFSDYAKAMQTQDWLDVSNKIKSSQSETVLIAQYDDAGKIVNIHNKNLNKKRPDDLRLRSYVDMVCESLAETENTYSLNELKFIPETHRFDISLLNPTVDIDIFGNNKDVWHAGNSFTFNELGFKTMPFFERLVCSNGMRSRDYGFGANVHQSRFNIAKIADEIRKAINSDVKVHMEMITLASRHLSLNNASIAEFEKFRSFFLQRSDDNPSYLKIVEKYFNDQPMYKAYGTNIAEKSQKWKSTANSGINAYDLFNLQTWIASHETESGITPSDAIDLQIAASNFFFKNSLDLEDIATPTNFEYPRLSVMN